MGRENGRNKELDRADRDLKKNKKKIGSGAPPKTNVSEEIVAHTNVLIRVFR